LSGVTSDGGIPAVDCARMELVAQMPKAHAARAAIETCRRVLSFMIILSFWLFNLFDVVTHHDD
jgi:hypothetical protein